MLILQENEACPHSNRCPYNNFNTCKGAEFKRETVFECDYFNNGVFSESGNQRSEFDLTGKMKVILG